MAAPAPARLYMDAVITPNRSLSPAGYALLIGALAAVNLIFAVFFFVMGAAPVPVFLGLDVLAVLIAFRVSYRSAQLQERVLVSAEEVRVLHQTPRSSRTVWVSPTAFTRVSVEQPTRHDTRVRLSLRQQATTVGRALSPRERMDFGDALQRAVRAALAERHPA